MKNQMTFRALYTSMGVLASSPIAMFNGIKQVEDRLCIILSVRTKVEQPTPFEQLMEFLGESPRKELCLPLGPKFLNKVTYPGFPSEFKLLEHQEILNKCVVYEIADGEHYTLEVELEE